MIPIKVPPLGESIVEATISRWLRNEGETVAAGDPLVELETDKITVEVPALKAGVLTRRLRAEGDVVKVDELLGELDENAAGASAPAPAAAHVAQPARPVPAAAATPSSVKASPAAQRMADQSGGSIDLANIAGSGRGGVVSKSDVIEQAGAQAVQRTATAPTAAAPQGASTPAPARTPPVAAAQPAAPRAVSGAVRETREKMSTRRKRIAEHLLESQHATAHLTTFNEIDMSAVMQLRERSKARVEKDHGVKLTFMPFFVKATCMALKSIPVVNAQVDGDSIVYRHYVNMGIAVASDQGLVVPNIRDADSKSMLEISRDISEVAARARDGKLTMDDLTGGTFTITNGGVFGSLVSTPIINFPQVGILGLHKIQDRPVAIDGRVEIRPMMYIALSYDHRIVDGQHSVLFLVRIKELMEDPASMLIE
jgi:2-oxoglutarate dehydrogenase E2 component (dihydrolipoamide succinyltransferase)